MHDEGIVKTQDGTLRYGIQTTARMTPEQHKFFQDIGQGKFENGLIEAALRHQDLSES